MQELRQVLQAEALREARAAEVEGLTENEIMQMRWLLTWKSVPGISGSTRKAKARLIILGFQNHMLTQLNTSAPTVSRLGKHMFYSLCALHGLTMETADASSAFLQSNEDIEHRNLFVGPLAEVAVALGLDPRSVGCLAKFSRNSYGLTNAPRLWWLDVCKNLRRPEYHKSSWDKGFWIL